MIYQIRSTLESKLYYYYENPDNLMPHMDVGDDLSWNFDNWLERDHTNHEEAHQLIGEVRMIKSLLAKIKKWEENGGRCDCEYIHREGQ